jgi:hypothetical protein
VFLLPPFHFFNKRKTKRLGESWCACVGVGVIVVRIDMDALSVLQLKVSHHPNQFIYVHNKMTTGRLVQGQS